MCRGGALAEHLKEEDRAGNGGIQARHSPDHRDADVEVDPATNRRREPSPLTPDHKADWPSEIGAAVILGGLRLRAYHANPSKAKCGELVSEVLNTRDKQVFHGSSARLDRSRRKGGRATSCHEDAVNPNRLGASDQAPKVLWILHSVKGQDEGGLSAADRSRQDLFRGNLWAASNHKRSPLMPVKPCELADQCPLHFKDGDAQGGGMEDDLLQRGATLRNDEELDCLTTGHERLFHRAPPRDQLLIGAYESECLHGDGAL